MACRIARSSGACGGGGAMAVLLCERDGVLHRPLVSREVPCRETETALLGRRSSGRADRWHAAPAMAELCCTWPAPLLRRNALSAHKHAGHADPLLVGYTSVHGHKVSVRRCANIFVVVAEVTRQYCPHGSFFSAQEHTSNLFIFQEDKLFIPRREGYGIKIAYYL